MKKTNIKKSLTKPKTKKHTASKKKQTKKLIYNKKYNSNKKTKSEKYKKILKNRIKYNMYLYKKGKYKSKKQAIAISYNQTNKHFNLH
jgi:hypothetical protein